MRTTIDTAQDRTTGSPIDTVEKQPEKRRALGRGLDSLLPSRPHIVANASAAPEPGSTPMTAPSQRTSVAPPAAQLEKAVPSGDSIIQLPLENIDENPYQTRRIFDQAALKELADSIAASGVVQPVVVRPRPDGRFTLILGERRCRAARLAGRTAIAAIIRPASDQQAAEMTVVENLQRQDLNCLEQANAFARLSREFGLTQEQIGQRTGCSRESVSNHMRLLKLPEPVQEYLADGSLGFSEARVLLQLVDPSQIPQIAREAIEKKMSVAQLIERVDRANLPREALDQQTSAAARWVDPNVRAAQTEMERVLGMRVRISDRKGKGKIVIEYASLEDFDRVLELLGRTK